QAHVFLTRLGYRDPSFDLVLEASQQTRVARSRERMPYRRLEVEWLRRGMPTGMYDTSEAQPIERSLTVPTDLLAGSRDDAYTFTHAVMEGAAFVMHPSEWPPDPAEICAEAEGLLARCLDQQDYDLTAEVLLT